MQIDPYRRSLRPLVIGWLALAMMCAGGQAAWAQPSTHSIRSFLEMQKTYLTDPNSYIEEARQKLKESSLREQPQVWLWNLWFLSAYQGEIAPVGRADLDQLLTVGIEEAHRRQLVDEEVSLTLAAANIQLIEGKVDAETALRSYETLLQTLEPLNRPDLVVFVKAEYSASLLTRDQFIKSAQVMSAAQDELESLRSIDDVYLVRIKSRRFFSFYYQNQWELATAMAQEVIALSRQMQLPYFEMIHLSNLGLALTKSDQNKKKIEALVYLKEALELTERLELNEDRVFMRAAISSILVRVGKQAEALKYGLEALKLIDALKVTRPDTVSYANIVTATAEVELNQFEQAIFHAEEAQKWEMGGDSAKADIERILYLAYEGLGNRDKAYSHLISYMNTFTQLSKDKESQEYNKASVQMGLQAVREENVLNRQKIKETERMRIVFIVLLSLSGMIIALMARSIREKRIIRSSRLKMQTILNNIDEAILTINHNLKIEPGYSAYVNQLLGTTTDFSHKDFFSGFVPHLPMKSEAKSMMQEILLAALGQDPLSWDLNAHNLPTDLQFETANGQRFLTLHWVPIKAHQRIEKVLLSIRDMTERKGLEDQIGFERKLSDRLSQVMIELYKAGPRHLTQILDEAQSLGIRLDSAQDLTDLRRSLHSLKGLARSFGLRLLSQACHELEDSLSQPVGHLSEHKAALDFKDLLHVYLEVKKRLSRDASPSGEALGQTIHDLVQSILPDLLLRLRSHQIALERLDISDEVQTWSLEETDILQKTLLHCLNNSIDHGYILPKEQGRAMGPVVLQLAAQTFGGYRELVIRDFGAGIDVDSLRQKARDKGFPLQGSDPEAISELLFRDGLSTAPSISATSGRGIGLAALRALTLARSGDIRIMPNDQGQGTMVRLRLPVERAAQAS